MPVTSPGLSRRQILGAVAAGVAASGVIGIVGNTLASPRIVRNVVAGRLPALLNGDPFTLGVASGDPTPDGFVLWTRLTPAPFQTEPGNAGGMPTAADLIIRYEIAADPQMRQVLRAGDAIAEARFAHSVHLEIGGLPSGRPYWYRFRAGGVSSPTGRAITLPAPGIPVERFRFAFASCANYEHGYFSAYRHLASEQPDLVLFLGDYIYECVDRDHPVLRRHSDQIVPTTLPQYRNRYAQYRLDPDLQRLHAEATSLVTWDDHEVQNDYAGPWSETFDDPARFLARRAAAYQAFYEHMPLRPSRSRPEGANLRIYDCYAVGYLAAFSVLDGRQYRSREACYGPPNKGGGHVETVDSCPEIIDAKRSMLGEAQEAWLFDGLAQSPARWNIIAQNVLMAQLHEHRADGSIGIWTEAWDGYPASRARLLSHIHESQVANPVVIGGDNHAFWNNDLKLDFDDPKSPVVATEFVGSSITSHGPPFDVISKWLPDNPHLRFFESRRRGYVMVDLTPDRMTTRMRAISDPLDPAATVSTLKTFVVENGCRGAATA